MKTLIIGGVAGGATVAARLRRLDETAQIILFERGEHISYANCGLPYYIGGTIRQRENLFLQTPEGFRQRFLIDVRTQHEVTAIDASAKTVKAKNRSTGEEYTESYDKLVISTGAEPLRLPIKGINDPRIVTLRNIPDTDRLKELVSSTDNKRAVVIGGGFIGLEMAENFREAGMEVTVIERAGQVMAPLDYAMAAIVHHHLQEKGVQLILEDGVREFRSKQDAVTVLLESGIEMETDLVLLSMGVRPESQLARGAGLALTPQGNIVVDSHMQTSDASIYALGDAVEILHRVTGKPTRIPLAGPANKQGRIVAGNIVSGNQEEFTGAIGTSIAKVFDLTVAAAGINARQLKQESIPYLASFTHGKSHAGYYPDAKEMSVKLLFSPDTGKLLGAQIVGYGGVDKRIDLLAQVIRNGGTIADLMEMEHAYAPPYSSAKDPVNMAGFVAENIFTGKVKVVHWDELDPTDTDTWIVDVRTADEFSMGTLPGAIHIPLDELRDRMNELPKEKRIILTCAVGLRGYLAYRILIQHGFDRVYNLSGGYRTWAYATGTIVCTVPPTPLTTTKKTPPSSVTPTIEVDACGLQCPGPVVQLRKHYQELEPGNQLLIKVTDPGFARDISAWCNMTGAELVGMNQESGTVSATIRKPEPERCCTSTGTNTLPHPSAKSQTIIVFSNDLDKAIAAFILANGAAAAGKRVSLFFTFWGLTILKKQEKIKSQKDFLSRMFGMMLPAHSGKLGLSQLNMGGMGGWFMRKVMKKKNVYSLETLIGQAKENGVQMIACTMSMDVMGILAEELIDGVELGGVATYMEQAEQSNLNLFI